MKDKTLTAAKVLLTICLLVGIPVSFGIHLAYAAKTSNAEEYRVWQKVTGNPKNLTYEEYLVWRNMNE
jgi:hypothetical protein